MLQLPPALSSHYGSQFATPNRDRPLANMLRALMQSRHYFVARPQGSVLLRRPYSLFRSPSSTLLVQLRFTAASSCALIELHALSLYSPLPLCLLQATLASHLHRPCVDKQRRLLSTVYIPVLLLALATLGIHFDLSAQIVTLGNRVPTCWLRRCSGVALLGAAAK